WWSSRGGELAKPDFVTPGVAFSAVPRWDTGNEIKGGTSMAAPHAAGLAACLISAMLQEGRRVSAAEVAQALRASAVPFAGATAVDEGAGMPRLDAAYRWLLSGHQGSEYVVRTSAGGSGAFRRDGLAGPGDTVQLFALPSTIIVPFELASKPLYDERRAIGPARVQRYFLRASQPGGTLAARVTLPDSAEQRATVRLYEPNGQPFRDVEEVQLGRT